MRESYGQARRSDKLVAYIDGGARGNPGPAGAGVHLELGGNPLQGLYKFLGERTNNYAEYSALLQALEFALKRNFKELDVYSDSQLLVRQILGQYRVKNPALEVLHRQARELIQQLDHFSIRHVPREQNGKADALANKAMNLRRSGEDLYNS